MSAAPRQPGEAGADRLHPTRRQEVELQRKGDDQHQAEPEGRGRVEEQRRDRHGPVDPGAAPHGGQHAEEDPEQDRDGDRGEDQEHGRRQPLDDEGHHRRLADGRGAEVKGQHLPHVG